MGRKDEGRALVRLERPIGLWKAIRKLGHLMTPSFDFVVGDGRKVRF